MGDVGESPRGGSPREIVQGAERAENAEEGAHMLLVLASIPLMVLVVAVATVPIVLAMRREALAQREMLAPVPLPEAWRTASDDVPAAA